MPDQAIARTTQLKHGQTSTQPASHAGICWIYSFAIQSEFLNTIRDDLSCYLFQRGHSSPFNQISYNYIHSLAFCFFGAGTGVTSLIHGNEGTRVMEWISTV
jgi:hypothetical protein